MSKRPETTKEFIVRWVSNIFLFFVMMLILTVLIDIVRTY